MASELDRLREHLRANAVLYSSPSHRLRGRNGSPVPWMFYSWGTTLNADGLRLAARCLITKLRQSFEARQLAAHGFTAQPLLAACVLESAGDYRGLAIRDRLKTYGSCRQIEGSGRADEPVVVLDDSISSGKSLRAAITALEDDGYRVEGAVCLVEFSSRGGTEWARALGYRVEPLFDIWRDLHMPIPPYVPGYRRVVVEWDPDSRIEDGLPPAVAVRRVADSIQRTGRTPLPPRTFDCAYAADGGVYVSFRDRITNRRLARDGFWHFDRADADPCRDLVLATAKTMRSPLVLTDDLRRLKIAATFLGAVEPINPAGLDYAQYGILVRSRVYPTKVGGALPNTQVFTSEIEQYRHARFTNAQLSLAEGHELFRYTVQKHVEPGEEWLPYGAPDHRSWQRDPHIGKRLTERARDAIKAEVEGSVPTGAPLPDDLIPDPLYAVAVTLWNGGVAGCWVSWDGSLDECVTRATAGALRDSRFPSRREQYPAAVSVSVLHDREQHGVLDAKTLARKIRRGQDSIAVRAGTKRAILLSHVAVHNNLDKLAFVRSALRKANLGADQSAAWSTLQTSAWLDDGKAVTPLEFGFPRNYGHDEMLSVDAAIPLLSAYIARHRRSDGLPTYCYYPSSGRDTEEGTAGRVLHAATALYAGGSACHDGALAAAAAEAIAFAIDRTNISANGVTMDLPHLRGGRMAEAQLLTAIARSGIGIESRTALAVAASVRALLHPDGSISPDAQGRNVHADHDYLPGVVLLALANFVSAAGDHSFVSSISAQLDWYRRRFRLMHPWGMAGWHPQAWAALFRASAEPAYAEFAFEMADWALEFQQRGSGAFLTDLDVTGPSFHTAFIAEAIADCARLASELGDAARAARYTASAHEAWGFMQQLVIKPADTYCMPEPEAAIGGVRESRFTSWVRIDFVSHTLEMLLKLQQCPRLQEA